MKRTSLSILTGLVLSLNLSPASAAVLGTATTSVASRTALYGVFHDRPTNFVFVRLPRGWVFVGRDDLSVQHDVFFDEATGVVFVKLSGGWTSVGRVTP